jgi:hypothetical protein
VRIVIAGPPKTGNVWLKCLLSTAYGLRALGPGKVPERPEYSLFKAWVEQGGFPDGAVFHQHYDYSDDLADAIEAVPAKIVTIIRDPYDTFVSSYFTLQRYADGDETSGRKGRRDALKGKPLDHPDVLDYLRRGGFRNNMLKANAWVASGRGQVVRYEDLHGDPLAALARLGETLGPLPPERIGQAVETCSADNMRKMGGGRSAHVRAARVGDSRDRLTEDHLAIFREKYADLIRTLGYDVR